MNWNDLRLRLRALLFHRRAESELDEELQFHLAMQARKHRTSGTDADIASREARAQFGGWQQAKEECRDVRGIRWMEALSQDVLYALRGFRHTPGFALTVICTIALGLGLNTALFTGFNAFVLRSLAVNDPQGLYHFNWKTKSSSGRDFNWQEFQDFSKQNPAFTEVMGIESVFSRVDGHMLLGNLVTGNYFTCLGVTPALGRTLLPTDMQASGTNLVMVLSYTAWRDKFGGDANIIGRKILVRGQPLEVVGVARPEFAGLSGIPVDYWAPLASAPLLKEGGSFLSSEWRWRINVTGRLKPGMSLKQAEAALTLWASQYTAERAALEKSTGVFLQSEATRIPLTPELIAACMPVLLAFGMVLLIACANIANLMLARAMARQREIGVRLAMGATRLRLVAQLLMESVLLAVPAGVAGFVLSQVLVELCPRLMFSLIPSSYTEFVRIEPLTPDVRIFVFMLVAAITSALLFGLAPAIQATRPDMIKAARGEFTTDFRPARLRNALIIAQVSVSALLLICTFTLLRASNQIGGLNPGIRTHGVVEIETQDKLLPKTIREIEALPFVRTIAAANKAPLTGILPNVAMGAAKRSERTPVRYIYVSPEYFPVFDIPILRGRNFTAGEAQSAEPVAILSQATARLLWPEGDALGQLLRIDQPAAVSNQFAWWRPAPPAYTEARVIGIAPDVLNGYIGDGIDPTCVYFPRLVNAAGSVLLVRVEGDSGVAAAKMDKALAQFVPGAVDQIHTMDEIHTAQLFPYRAAYLVSSALGVLALLLTLSGLYGVLSYLVTQRTKEIGIRVALGARAGKIAGMVLRQSLKLAAIGSSIGALAALGAARGVGSLLEMPVFNSVDGAAFGLGVLVVSVAAACAAYIPARRAARIEPLTTLRHD